MSRTLLMELMWHIQRYIHKGCEKLLAEVKWDKNAKREKQFEWESWEEEIRKIYTGAADGVIALQKKLGWYDVSCLKIYKERWQEICEVLEEAPSSEELAQYLNSVGLDLDQFDKMYGLEKICNALKYGKDLKDRYSVLWMYYELLVD